MGLLLPHEASRSVSDMTRSGREGLRAKLVFAGVFALGLALAVNCVGPRGGMAQLTVIGDENGGSIPHSLGSHVTQSAAYQLITTHCSKFGKKSFITQMDFEGGTMTFVCILQRPTARP
jgi:hypothetical protein